MRRTAPVHQPEGPFTSALGSLEFCAAAVLLLGLPMLVDLRALDPFRGPKQELALAAWAVLAAAFAARNLAGRSWRDPWWGIWAGVLGGGAVSALASGHGIRVAGNLIPLLLAALGWGAIRQSSEVRRAKLAHLVVWAGLLEAAVSIVFLVPDWQPVSFAGLGGEVGRYAWLGTLGNPADIAIFLALPALLAAHRAVTARRSRWFYGGAALLMLGVVIATRTLTVIAALAAGIAVLVWTVAPRRFRIPVLAAGAALFIGLMAMPPLRERIARELSNVRHSGWLWVGSARASAYSAAVGMIEARPLTGVGFGLFEANSFRFQDLDTLAARGQILGLITGFGEAHNDPLQYAAETGLIGVALAATGLAFALRRRPRGAGEVTCAAVLGAAATVVVLTQFPLHLSVIAAQWAILAALSLPPLPDPPVPTRRAAQLRLLAVAAVTTAVGFLAWERYTARIAVGEARLLATSLRSNRMNAQTKVEVARAALSRLRPKARWLPDSWEAQVTVGNLAVTADDVQLGLSSFARALEMADRPEVRFDVGMTLLLTGEHEAGMADLVRAVELNPAVFREIKDPDLSRAVRRRLDASGYGAKHAWMYEKTPAASP